MRAHLHGAHLERPARGLPGFGSRLFWPSCLWCKSFIGMESKVVEPSNAIVILISPYFLWVPRRVSKKEGKKIPLRTHAILLHVLIRTRYCTRAAVRNPEQEHALSVVSTDNCRADRQNTSHFTATRRKDISPLLFLTIKRPILDTPHL